MSVPTIVIIGGSFAGSGVATNLEKQLSGKAQVILIEKKPHFHNCTASPRAIVDLAFADKTFITLSKLFKKSDFGSIVHDTVTKVGDKEVTLASGTTIAFDYLVIAAGSSYRSPFKSDKSTKEDILAEYSKTFEAIQSAQRILIVGGGPVGIESSAEIKVKFPEKDVTLVHSGDSLGYASLSSGFNGRLKTKLEALGVKIVLGEKVQNLENASTAKSFTTDKGTVLDADHVIVATGTGKPHSSFMEPSFVNDKGEIKVLPTFQLDEQHSNVFALGDVAASGDPKLALKAGDRKFVIARLNA